jgi:hypothetical protein
MEYLAFVLLLPFVLASIYVLASGLRPSKSGSPRLPPRTQAFSSHWEHLGAHSVGLGFSQHIGDQPHRALSKLSKTYGPLMTLKLESMTTSHFLSRSSQRSTAKTRPNLFRPNYPGCCPSTQPPQILNGVAARNGSLGKPQESFCHANFFSTKAQFHTSR